MIGFLIALGVALVLDLLLGDPHSRFHPVALFGRAAGGVETLCRKTFGNGILSGLTGWLLLVLPISAAAWAVTRFAGEFAPAVAAVLLYVTIAPRSLLEHAEAIRKPLSRNDLAAARRALSMIVSRDTATLPPSEIVRGAIESLGENLIDAVNSALFFFAVGFLAGGLPGAAAAAVLLRCANTLDACWGYRNERYLFFGRVAARVDDLFHLIPARLTLLAVAIAAPLVGGRISRTLRTGFRHRHDHPSPNSAWGMGAFAGALQIRLGGPTVYGGIPEPYPFWGDGRAELTTGDLLRAERLTAASTLVFCILLIIGVSLCK